MPGPRIYRFPDLKPAGVPFHRVYVDKLEKRGQFPKRFNYGPNSVAWVAEEVDQWVQGRIASRGAPAVPLVPEPNAGHLSESETEPDVTNCDMTKLSLLATGIGLRPLCRAIVEQNLELHVAIPIRHKPTNGRGRPVGAKDRRPRQRRQAEDGRAPA
jgi:prophage regulatory protein